MSILDSEVAHEILHSFLEWPSISRPEPTLAFKLPFDQKSYPMMDVSLTVLSEENGQQLLQAGLEDIKTPWWATEAAARTSASG